MQDQDKTKDIKLTQRFELKNKRKDTTLKGLFANLAIIAISTLVIIGIVISINIAKYGIV